MSVTDAMAEAYATQPAGEVIIDTLELDHPTFDEPVRIATGVQEDITLPLTLGGDTALFRALQISLTLPGMDADGPTPAKVRIDNVSSLLLPYIRAAIQSTDPISVVYRGYTTSDLTQPGDVIEDLELRDVSLSPSWAEGTLTFKQVELQAFPLATYDEEHYPTLQNN